MLKTVVQISGSYFASTIITAGLVRGWNKSKELVHKKGK